MIDDESSHTEIDSGAATKAIPEGQARTVTSIGWARAENAVTPRYLYGTLGLVSPTQALVKLRKP